MAEKELKKKLNSNVFLITSQLHILQIGLQREIRVQRKSSRKTTKLNRNISSK